MSTHDLKIQRQWFDRIVSGEKTAEIRKHDRDFQAGDTLALTIDPPRYVDGVALAETVRAAVLHILPGHLAAGIDDDYCVLSIQAVPTEVPF